MITNPQKAIKQFCYECSGESWAEVKRCTSVSCPLFDFRFGKNPFRQKRILTDEQKAKNAERLAEARERRKSTE